MKMKRRMVKVKRRMVKMKRMMMGRMKRMTMKMERRMVKVKRRMVKMKRMKWRMMKPDMNLSFHQYASTPRRGVFLSLFALMVRSHFYFCL